MKSSGIIKNEFSTEAESIVQSSNRKANTDLLAHGYKEMSRINLNLAEEAVSSDNEALSLCEEYFGV